MQQTKAATVDCHAHIFHKGMELAPDAWAHPAHEAPLEAYLAFLDEHGIDRAVLAAASVFGTNNIYALQATSSDPRLRTTVIVDCETTRAQLRELDRRGAIGIRLQWRSTPKLPDLRSQEYRSLFAAVADLGWHVQLHDNGPRLPGAIDEIGQYGMPLVIDHYGRPSMERGTLCEGFKSALAAIQRGNTWIKMSAGFRIGPESLVAELAKSLLQEAGPERLLWGSDWPFVDFESSVTYSETIEQFERLVPDPDARDRIHASARALYFGD